MKFDIIISDIHLKMGPEDKGRRKKFETFLRSFFSDVPRRIICLGDIFDFWFEYRYVMFAPYFGVLSAFYELSNKGTELIFIGGNHDFWAGDILKEVGFKIMDSGTIIELDRIKVMLIHGDGLNRDDYGYRFFKKVSRNRFMISMFRVIHPDIALKVASMMSRGSRKIQESRSEGQLKDAHAIKEFAVEMFEKRDVDAVISGHCHVPECCSFEVCGKKRWYVNSGDWVENYTYVLWNGEEFMLKKAAGG